MAEPIQPPTPSADQAAREFADQYDIGEPSPSAPSAGATEPAPSASPEPSSVSAINSAGRPFDPSTGRLLPVQTAPEDIPEVLQPEPPSLNPHLTRLASDLGIDTDGVSEDYLWGAVRAAQRAVQPQRRAADINESMEQWRNGQPPATPAARPSRNILAEWNDDVVAPEFSGPVKKVINDLFDRIEQLEGFVRQDHHARTTRENTSELDRAYIALNDPRLGKGTFEDIGSDSAEYARRGAIWQQAQRMAGPNPTNRQICAKIKAARDLIYGEAPKPAAKPLPKAPSRLPADAFERGATARPTHRAGAEEMSGIEKAIQSVSEIQQEANKNGQVGTLDDEFPD